MRHAHTTLLLMAALTAPACEHEPAALEGDAAGTPANHPNGGKPGSAGTGGTRAQPTAAGAGGGGRAAAGANGASAVAGRSNRDEDDAGTHELTLDRAMNEYMTWTRRQAEPRPISAQIFSLCRAPSKAETAFTESVHGASLSLLDWLNDEAAKGLAAGGKPAFPVGSAIVKQKLMAAGADTKLVALGIMIKRASSFDPEHGGWEFGYWEEAPGQAFDAELSTACGDCHAQSSTDFVFVDESWRLDGQ